MCHNEMIFFFVVWPFLQCKMTVFAKVRYSFFVKTILASLIESETTVNYRQKKNLIFEFDLLENIICLH